MLVSRTLALFFALSGAALLAGCDSSSIPGMGPDPRVAQREADAKAIGGGCRFGLRSPEDCYALNDTLSKAAVFAGWKDMDQYMRDHKIDGKVSTESIAPPKVDEDEAPAPAKASRKARKSDTKTTTP